MEAAVDLSDVQGNIVHSYGRRFACARFVRLRVKHDADDRHTAEVLGQWLGRVSFGRRPAALPDDMRLRPHLNVAFTAEGLTALGVPAAVMCALPAEFRAGARARAGHLGDRWPVRSAYEDCHVLLAVHGTTAEQVAVEEEALRDGNAKAGAPFEVIDVRHAGFAAYGPRREPFGFVDGGSQPAVDGVDLDPVGDGVYATSWGRSRRRVRGLAEDIGLVRPERAWRLVRTGEFLLGHTNEDGELPPGSEPPLGPNGTFMVYREMDQDVDAFEAYVAKSADALGLSARELREKIVGRRRHDGSPLVRPADEYPRELQGQPHWEARNGRRRRANDFLYAEDPHGFNCPLGAHVRRANPRDGLAGGGDVTARHRIIRRGMPYDAPDGGEAHQHGLVFICFNASLKNGFELIQRTWINDGHAFGLGPEPDFLLQQPDDEGRLHGRMVIQGYRPAVLPPPDTPFVTVRGCEYLLVPSRSACAWLATLRGPR
jgi:Dyp-type peroxidase family